MEIENAVVAAMAQRTSTAASRAAAMHRRRSLFAAHLWFILLVQHVVAPVLTLRQTSNRLVNRADLRCLPHPSSLPLVHRLLAIIILLTTRPLLLLHCILLCFSSISKKPFPRTKLLKFGRLSRFSSEKEGLGRDGVRWQHTTYSGEGGTLFVSRRPPDDSPLAASN